MNIKPYQYNIINAVILLLMGIWGYMVSASPTALIAPVFGLIFLLATPLFKAENKVVAHLIVVLTLMLLISLVVKPLPAALKDNDTAGIARVGLMSLSCAIAMVIYIKSFIDVRKNRQKSQI